MVHNNVFIETGDKRTFASAVDWPGWSRSGKDEPSALQALADYAPRYARAIHGSGIEFLAPVELSTFKIVERLKGGASTDFGAPGQIPEADRAAASPAEIDRLRKLLQACWQAFDKAVQQAAGKTLRKGPRGGGRDTEEIVLHVVNADWGYLSRLGRKPVGEAGNDLLAELSRTRQAILSALDAAAKAELPERGPRGGAIWPARYYVRRAAWHVLDHAWEIEDRVE